MTYPQCLIAQRTGEILKAQLAGCEIDVIVVSCATKVATAWSTQRAQYIPVGDPYFSVECRDARGNGVYHMAPELLACRDEKIREELDRMVEREQEEEIRSWQKKHL